MVQYNVMALPKWARERIISQTKRIESLEKQLKKFTSIQCEHGLYGVCVKCQSKQ